MGEIFTKFFTFVFVTTPTFLAQVVFAILIFLPSPYRAVMRLALYSRQNKIPTILYLSFVFALLMFVFGLLPVPDVDTNSSFSSIILTTSTDMFGNLEKNKQNILYLLFYALGMTSFVALTQISMETLLFGYFGYSRPIFHNLSNIAIALALPWMSAALVLAGVTIVKVARVPGASSIAIFGSFTALPLPVVPIAFYAARFELRWNRAATRRKKVFRATLLTLVGVVVLAAAVSYLIFLSDNLLKAEHYSGFCTSQDKTVYATIVVDNRGDDVIFVNNLYVSQDALNAGGKQRYLKLNHVDLMQGLKKNVAVEPHQKLKFRASFLLDSAVDVHGTCAVSLDRPEGTELKAQAKILPD